MSPREETVERWIANAEQILIRRMAAGLSRHRLARISKTSRSTVERCEAGKTVSRSTLKLIAEALNAPPEAIGGPPPRYSREHCHEDCLKIVAEPTAELTIRTLALDLSAGSESIVHTVDKSQAEILAIEVLVLADEDALPPRMPDDVLKWGRTATTGILALAKKLGGMHGAKEFTLEVKRYAAKPTVHGVGVTSRRGSVARSRYYLTECSHFKPVSGLPAYLSGDGEYQIADLPAPAGRPRRLLRRFEDLFHQYWMEHATVLRYSGGRLEYPAGDR